MFFLLLDNWVLFLLNNWIVLFFSVDISMFRISCQRSIIIIQIVVEVIMIYHCALIIKVFALLLLCWWFNLISTHILGLIKQIICLFATGPNASSSVFLFSWKLSLKRRLSYFFRWKVVLTPHRVSLLSWWVCRTRWRPKHIDVVCPT